MTELETRVIELLKANGFPMYASEFKKQGITQKILDNMVINGLLTKHKGHSLALYEVADGEV